jgi:hypothetical protein
MSAPLQERMRANAALLSMMAKGEIPLRRKDLIGLVEDLRAWAGELDAAEMREFTRRMIAEGRQAA